jgi:hypothetical protein
MFLRHLAALAIIGALASAAPSSSALNPARAVCDLNEGDLTGSGFEIRAPASVEAQERDDDSPDLTNARRWRAMAARCRNLAQWQNDGAREVLLQLAAEYEERAQRAEASQAS